MAKPLTESVVQIIASGPQELTAIFIGEGMSLNKRLYPAEVLKKAAPLFKGAPIYIDHPTFTEMFDRPERSLRDLAGIVTKARFGEFETDDGTKITGVGGTIKVASQSTWMVDLYEEKLAGDMSIVAYLEGDEVLDDDDEFDHFEVTKIDSIVSVDFVTTGAAKGQITDGADESERIPIHLPDDKVDESLLVYIDRNIGQALQVSENALMVVESETLKKEDEEPEADPDEGEPEGEPDADPDTEEPEGDPDEGDPDPDAEPEEDPDETGEAKVLSAIEDLKTHVDDKFEDIEDRLGELEKPPEDDSEASELLDRALDEALDAQDLEPVSIRRIRRMVGLADLKSNSIVLLAQGKNEAQVLDGFVEAISNYIAEERQNVSELAAPTVTGLGGHGQSAEDIIGESDVEGTLEQYGLIRPREVPVVPDEG